MCHNVLYTCLRNGCQGFLRLLRLFKSAVVGAGDDDDDELMLNVLRCQLTY